MRKAFCHYTLYVYLAIFSYHQKVSLALQLLVCLFKRGCLDKTQTEWIKFSSIFLFGYRGRIDILDDTDKMKVKVSVLFFCLIAT